MQATIFSTAFSNASNTSDIDNREFPGGGVTAQCVIMDDISEGGWINLLKFGFQCDTIEEINVEDRSDKDDNLELIISALLAFTSRVFDFLTGLT